MNYKMKVLIREEVTNDFPKISEVIISDKYREWKDINFNEWTLVNRIRESNYYINKLSLIAEVEGEIVGHIMFTPIRIIDNKTSFNSLRLAPLSIHKNYHKKGIGKQLANYGLGVAEKLNYESVIAIGHPEYFPNLGFMKASNWNIYSQKHLRNEPVFALELVENALAKVKGQIEYCPLFFDDKGNLFFC